MSFRRQADRNQTERLEGRLSPKIDFAQIHAELEIQAPREPAQVFTFPLLRRSGRGLQITSAREIDAGTQSRGVA
jgi:hypothetical protein